MASLRVSTLKAILEMNERICQHWLQRIQNDDLPFTDSDEEIEPQEEVARKLVADLTVLEGNCDTLIRSITGED